MLEVNNLTITINNKTIIENLNFVANKKDKIAIIGEEGNGKSTLLKVMVGINNYALVTGTIDYKKYRLGYLEQQLTKSDLNKSVFDYLFIDETDYYNKLNVLYKHLNELDLNDTILKQSVIENLSGGEKVKLQLLKILLSEADILLLDEPTNDLDINTLKWLEKFIIQTDKPIIFVSHDETLLSKTANAILHLELVKKKQQPRNTFLRVGYENYIQSRFNKIEHDTQIANKEKQQHFKQEAKLKQLMNKVEYQQNKISRADPHGARMLKKKMKTIKSQERRFEKQETTEKPTYEEAINFTFEDVFIPKQKIIIDLKNLSLKINEKVLVENINLNVKGNEHIVIIGDNGTGKTTLLKLIYQQLKTRTDLKIGYMPQDYDTILNNYQNPYDFLGNDFSKEEQSLIGNYMGNMNLTYEEMNSTFDKLSGGTKAKLFLLKLVLTKCNVLLLDEPTRNISPLSNPIIRQVLKNYRGSIISISHDRSYIKEVADSIYKMTSKDMESIDRY